MPKLIISETGVEAEASDVRTLPDGNARPNPSCCQAVNPMTSNGSLPMENLSGAASATCACVLHNEAPSFLTCLVLRGYL